MLVTNLCNKRSWLMCGPTIYGRRRWLMLDNAALLLLLWHTWAADDALNSAVIEQCFCRCPQQWCRCVDCLRPNHAVNTTPPTANSSMQVSAYRPNSYILTDQKYSWPVKRRLRSTRLPANSRFTLVSSGRLFQIVFKDTFSSLMFCDALAFYRYML